MDFTPIDNILNAWLLENDFDCSATADTDFAYYYSKSLITYALVVSEKMDRLFLDFAKRNGLKVDCGIFLLSFFHELGHNETLDLLDDEEYNASQKIKATLTDTEKDCEIYFNLADEYEATAWAIDYINNNTEKVKALADELQTEIKIFCEKNEITA